MPFELLEDIDITDQTVPNLDLLDAETTLSQAKLIRLRAFYDYTMSLYALDRTTGRKVW